MLYNLNMAAITINDNINENNRYMFFLERNIENESTDNITVPPVKVIAVFINDTDKPVILSTWGFFDFGMAIYKRIYINIGKKQTLNHSNTGEFIVDSKNYERIGKFRLKCSRTGGSHSWMNCDDYEIICYIPPGSTNPIEYRLVNSKKSIDVI